MLLSLVFVLRQSSPAWSQPIKIAGQSGVDYFDYTNVKFNSQNQIFVVYKAGTQIHLSIYDGKSVTFMKNVSESSKLCYAPFMVITGDDIVHIIWAECSSYDSDTQYIKYRYFNGSWSQVSTIITLDIPGSLPGGYTTRKIDTMRLAMDSRRNMFIVFQSNPATKSWLVSRYGTETILEPWVVTERHKFPDVAADDSTIHVIWQAKLNGMDGYTIKYVKKTNARNGKWHTPIDVKNNENINNSAHLPRITLDSNLTPHVIYMDDSPSGGGRNTFYRYLAGSRFSERFLVTENTSAYYSNIGISISNSIDNMIITNHVGYGINYNWKVNGAWTGNEDIRPMAAQPDNEAVDLSRDGKLAAVSCTSEGEAVYLIVSENELPPPPPPANLPPIASFNHSPRNGHFPLNVTFNAGDSQDNDGQIVSYSWDFDDGTIGQGMTPIHSYSRQGIFTITLTVTDNGGASASTSHQVEVFPPNIPPLVLFSYSPNNGHFPLSVTFNAKDSQDNDGQIVSYSWDFGDGTFGQGMVAEHTYTINGFRKITLTVTDDDGAWANKSGQVEVFPPNAPPVPLFEISPASGLYPLQVTFNAGNSRDSDGQIVSYSWDFGDGTFGQGNVVEHLYSKKNIYPISLTITDDDGAKANKSGQVEVFGLLPPLNVQYRRETNRNLFSLEYLYHITWASNPKNDEIGARIVTYNIYRKAKELTSYILFYTMPAGNQANYEYLDRTLNSVPLEYDYKITSLDNAGRESD